MKKQMLFSISMLFLLTGCKKGDFIVFGEPNATVLKECYEYDKDGNSISMQIETTGKDVFGAMTYKLSEKDKNAGFIKGKWENNILLLDYTFLSEGTESTRQVAFQRKDNQLIEGYGEMTEDGTKFKEVSQLKFTSTMPLSKIDCPK
ncbi:hypothetical protein [Flavobacterium sp.]|uniref:hypothetical protein n=1 Tax=Flavobacterium sp. TaxID=239 RepID=UPI00391A1D7A